MWIAFDQMTCREFQSFGEIFVEGLKRFELMCKKDENFANEAVKFEAIKLSSRLQSNKYNARQKYSIT